MKVLILGTEYDVSVIRSEDDPLLDEYDGYVDSTTKRIVVSDEEKEAEGETGTVGNPEAVTNRIMRHEIIHAFLFESGLGGSGQECDHWEANEEMVDWFALQWPKIHRAFRECGCENG